jgi:hypothetical protein
MDGSQVFQFQGRWFLKNPFVYGFDISLALLAKINPKPLLLFSLKVTKRLMIMVITEGTPHPWEGPFLPAELTV